MPYKPIIYWELPNSTTPQRKIQSNRRVCRLSTFAEVTVADFLDIDKVVSARHIPTGIGLSQGKWQDTYIVEHVGFAEEVGPKVSDFGTRILQPNETPYIS